MNKDSDPAQWIESVSEERDACRKVARARRWSLNQTLAWIAFGRLEPVAQDDDEEGLLVWSGIREALGRPIGFEISGLDEAWRQLAVALADGAFHGLGTVVSISRGGEVERHEPGQPLPPAAQAGLFMAYQLISDPSAVIASREERKRKQWVEYRDLSFMREDILREFPAGLNVINVEFERRPSARLQIGFIDRVEAEDAGATAGALWGKVSRTGNEAREATLAPDETRRKIAEAFDPMAQAWWSIPMALAYVCSQSVDDVRDQWDAYRAKVGDAPADWDGLSIAQEQADESIVHRPPDFIPLKPAASDFQRALEHGRFMAVGFRSHDGSEMQLEPMLWYDMFFDAEPHLGLICLSPRTGHAYEKVRLRRCDVLAFSQWLRDAIASDDPSVPFNPDLARDEGGQGFPYRSSDFPSAPRRGRRPQYDRPEFVAEVIYQLDLEGGLAPVNGSSFTQADLERRMEVWCAGRWEKTPSEASIRKFVADGIAQWKARNSG